MALEKQKSQSEKPKPGLITQHYVDLVDEKQLLDPTFDRQMLADLARNRPERLQAYLKKNKLTCLHLLILEDQAANTLEVTITDGTGAKETRFITRQQEAQLKPQALFVQRLVFEDFSIGKPYTIDSTTFTQLHP
ncbi:hypothetical protein GCM10027299_03350 [Larkinella ripae]